MIRHLDHGAVELADIDITQFQQVDYDNLRILLEQEQVVVLKKQTTNPWEYTRLIEKLTPKYALNYNQFAFETDGHAFSRNAVVPTWKWQGTTRTRKLCWSQRYLFLH